MQRQVKIYDVVTKDHMVFEGVDFIRFIRPDGSIPITVPVMNDKEMYTMRDEKIYTQPIHVIRRHYYDDPEAMVIDEKYYSFTPEMQEIVDAIIENHRRDDLKTINMYKGEVEKCKSKYAEINEYKVKIRELEYYNKEYSDIKQKVDDFNKQPWYTRVLLAIKGLGI